MGLSIVRLQAERLDPFHAGVYRFDEASLLKRDAVRNADGAALHNPIHDSNVLREATAGRLESSRAADFLVGLALGEGFVLAVIAFTARNVMKDNDAISGLKIADSRAHCGHHAGSFMAEDAGSGM